MTALVSLARCLSGHTKLLRDLRPAGPETEGAVDERVKLSLCCVTRRPGVLDPVEDLSCGSPGRRLRRARARERSLVWLDGSRLPGLLYRSAPRFVHAVNDARLSTTRVSAPSRPEASRGLTTRPALKTRDRRLARGADACNVMHITLLSDRSRWRSLADACGLWRTPAAARYEVLAFASWRR
jgi:hypothetical protein